MTNLKQSLPKRIISLLLAVAIMIGFVPLIDIDLTAFAATYGCIELDDNNPKSGDNWVWDNTTKTLSLYNAKITRPDSSSYAIKYDGTGTLKINQIGYNRIENGYIQAEDGSIEVVGSGILDISHDGCYMFNTPELNITNGYVCSDNAVALNSDDNKTTTVSNCVLDIPQAKIVAYAQPGSSTAGFIMESGYVNCETLKTEMSAVSGIPSAEIKGGYLKVGTIDGENNGQSTYYFVKLGTAVVKADTLTGATGYLFSGGNPTPTTLELNGSTLLIKNTDSLLSLYNNPQETIGDYKAYCGTRIGCAKYYGNDTTLTTLLTTTTIVCENNLTLNEVDAIPADTTIYCGGTLNYTPNTYGTINGCLIGKVILNGNATVGSTGRIYGKSLTLNGNATIANGGAVTVYNSDYNTKCLNFNNNSLTVNGDFSVKSNGAGSETAFNDAEKNITVGAAGQFAAVGDVDAQGGGFASAAVYNAITTGNNISRTVYASNSYHNNAMDCKKYENPSTVYIGKEFNPQLISLNSTQIICKKVYEDSADFNFLCSHNIENFSDVNVTIKTGGSGGADVTDKFNIQRSYSDTTEADKTKIKITLSLKEDIDAKGYTVAVTVDGLMATSTLTAKNINTTLDFTQTNAGAWEFFGAFGGTSAESKAANDMWAWYPNGAEGYTGKVLVLNGLDIETTAKNAIIVPDGTTIVVKGSSNVHSKNTAISCKGNVTIAGAGSSPILTAESDYSVPNHYAAIQSSGDITIKNISLHTSMGECDDSGSGYGTSGYSVAKKNYGIYGNNVHLIDVSGECKADNATDDNGDNDSAAICALSTIFIDESCALTLTAYTYALESATLKSAEVDRLVDAYNSDNTASYHAYDINRVIGENNVVSGITNIYTYSFAKPVGYHTKSNATVTIAENDKAMGDEITASAENGTPAYTPSTTEPDAIKVTKGADLTLTLKAKAGHYIKSLTVDGAYLIGGTTTTSSASLESTQCEEVDGKISTATIKYSAISESSTVYIEYAELDSYSVKITENDSSLGTKKDENGNDVASTTNVREGNDFDVTLSAKDGYYIKTITVDGVDWVANGRLSGAYLESYVNFESLVIEAEVLLENIQDNIEIDVQYEVLLTYAVTLSVGEHGTVSHDFEGSLTAVPAGTIINFTASPDKDYQISSVKVNGNTITTNRKAFSVTISQATQITVTFAKKSSGGGGGGYVPTPAKETVHIRYNESVKGWDAIDTYIRRTEEGCRVEVDMEGTSYVPLKVLQTIKGKNITVAFYSSDSMALEVNGKSVTDPSYMGVALVADGTIITADVLAQLNGAATYLPIFAEGGLCGDVKLMVKFDKANAGKAATLMQLDKNGKLIGIECATIGADGSVLLPLAQAGKYVVVADGCSWVLGDVNGDGKITIADAAAILKHVMNVKLLSDKQAALIDFNRDGESNIADAKAVLDYCFKIA